MELDKYAIAERFGALPHDKQKKFLDALRQRRIDFGQLPIPSQPGRQNSSLSYAQARQWFLWQLEPTSSAYHIAGASLLKGKLDLDALQASFNILIERHASLRTVFRAIDDGAAEQVILPSQLLAIPLHDLSQTEPTQRSALAQAHAQRITQTPFDLCIGPLLRAELIRLSMEEHVLVVVMHHIIADGWSLQVIVDEFIACYRARIEGREESLPALPIQYSDYSRWQRNWLEAGEKDRQLAYWTTQLGGEQPVLQLPTDYPRPATARYTAARHSFLLPETLQKELRTCAEAHGATIFMVLLAGFQALLHRYTGQEDIRVGVPIANRHRVETERVVGLFVNTQVLRNQMHGQMPLRQILEQAKQAAVDAQAHQDLPFEQLVEALQPERSLGQSSLFQVMVNHQTGRRDRSVALPNLHLSTYETAEQAAQFELTLSTIEDEQGRLYVDLIYARELFDATTIERMGGHYQTLLHALSGNMEHKLCDIHLLDVVQQRQLDDWGRNQEFNLESLPVHHQIERQAAQAPDAGALIFGEEELSYRELNAYANRIAHHLIALGAGPETRVGIAVERSMDMVAGLLGILKSGAAYVPLDPDYPQERLDYMVADSGIALVLTQRAVKHKLPASLHRIELDTLDLWDQPDHNPDVPLHADSLAYVIYTSGSTGKPKGVGVSHGPLGMHVQAIGHAYGMTAQDRELQFASISFDGAHERTWVPLAFGAALMPRDNQLWTVEQTCAAMQRHRITLTCLTPSYLHQLAELMGEKGHIPSLRSCTVGGEAMSRSTHELVRKTVKPPRLINGYGPTETVITPMLAKLEGEATFDSAYMPIGRLIGDRTAWVLDADLNLLPLGIAGELYLGGSGLARGYLNRPGLSAERFIADPFDMQGGRLYRTGDLVRWRTDGQLEYLGRIDHQVKVRGFRIELGEIEAQLLAQEEIKEAIVTVQQQDATARLVAHVAGMPGSTLSTSGLKERLKRVLPDYMVPHAIVVLERLPLMGNGKVDRQALPQAAYGSEQAYEAPQGEVEQALADIWARVLEVERVGRHDNFFELGGDSLRALKVVALLKDAGNSDVDIRLKDLMYQPTIAELAGKTAQSKRPTSAVLAMNQLCEESRPLFCMHPAMGTVFAYQTLARRLQGRCTVYGVSCRMLFDEVHHDISLDQMAYDYSAMMRSVQPEGPYRLLGFSLGGPLAAMVARHLEAAGESVELLALVDPYVHGLHTEAMRDWKKALVEFVIQVLPGVTAAEVEALLAEDMEETESLAEQVFDRLIQARRNAHSMLPGFDHVGAKDLARAFVVARHLGALSLQVRSLKPLKVQPHCWWAAERPLDARLELARQLGVPSRFSTDIDVAHTDIVTCDAFTTSFLSEFSKFSSHFLQEEQSSEQVAAMM